jgi:hypothetical protein
MNSKSSLFALLFLLVGNNLHLVLCKAHSSNFTATTAIDLHDVIRVRSRREGGRQVAKINEVGVERSLYRDPMDRQGDVWKMINSMETYKTNSRQFASTRLVIIAITVCHHCSFIFNHHADAFSFFSS